MRSSNSSEQPPPRVLLVGYGPTAPAAYRSIRGNCRLAGVVCDPAPEDREGVRAMATRDGIPVFSGETSAGLDPNDPTAFVTGLNFTGTGTIEMTMTPITEEVGGVIPEPSSLIVWSLLATFCVAVGSRRRRGAV